jgi:transcriptional regulator with XRE-family HTH domain
MEVDITALRELREEKAYSVRELADLAGVSRTTLWKLETTGGKAHPRTIRKLAEALGVEPRELQKRD